MGDPGLRRAVSLLFLLGYMFILLPMVLYTGARFMQSMFQLELSIMAIATMGTESAIDTSNRWRSSRTGRSSASSRSASASESPAR